MKKITLHECQQLLLDMSKLFHKICVKHGIDYYMIGGTMLGAIRHKGFIPWDDDVDFAVHRKNYDNLIEILNKDLPQRYKVITYKNSIYPLEFLKIEDTYTIIDDPARTDTNVQLGINIDIFPLDECSADINSVKMIYGKKAIYNSFVKGLYFTSAVPKWYKSVGRLIIKPLKYWIRKDFLYKYYIHLVKELNQTGNDALTSFSSHYMEKSIFKKQVWGEPILYDFEDTQFYGVMNYERYLTELFHNYMELPPLSKREVHAINYYIK